MKTPRLSHAVLVVAAAFGGCTARLSAGTVRYNVVHLEPRYGSDLNYWGMAKDGTVTALSETGITIISHGQATSFSYPFPGYYTIFGNTGVAYVQPVQTAEIWTVRPDGSAANTGYVATGNQHQLIGQNRLGAVVGMEAPVYDPVAGYNHNAGFLYSPASGGQTVVQMGGVLVAEFHVVNDVGWLAGFGGDGSTGSHLYLWVPGQPAISLARTRSGAVYDMNSRGEIVGIVGDSAFYWNSGTLLNLGSIPVEDPTQPGVFNNAAGATGAIAITEDGMVGGYSLVHAVAGYTPPPSRQVGWLWSPQRGLEYVSDMIDPSLGIEITSVGEIADDGTLYAGGTVPGYLGRQHFLLVPVPEPSGSFLLALGSSVILLRRRR